MKNGAVLQRISRNAAPDSLHGWLRDFVLDVLAANRSERTVQFYVEKLGPFLAFLEGQGVTEPGQIGPTHIRAFLAELAHSRGGGGVHAYWRAVRAFVRFLVREDALDRNPLDKVRAPKVDQELLNPVLPEVVQALLATCDRSEVGQRDRAMLLALLDTGLRAGEFLRLNVGDVNLEDGSVAVRLTKSREGRYVFVGRQARRAVAAYLRKRARADAGQPLWMACRSTGERTRLSYDGLRDMLKRRAAKAGVPAPTPHSFRRAFALSMLRSGVNVVTLSRLMGHGSLPVLTRYLKQVKDDLGEAHALHSPADNLTQ